MMVIQPWSWLGRRRSREHATAAGGGPLPAAARRTPGDQRARAIVEQLHAHDDGDRAHLTTTLTGWIARQERSMGGGALDLVLFSDSMWREEAVRALACITAPEGPGCD